MKKLVAMMAFAGLAACGGQTAHAANADLFVDQNSGRLYTMANAAEVYAPGTGQFTVRYEDGTSQTFLDNGNAQMQRISIQPVFASAFVKVQSYAPRTGYSYFSPTKIRGALCNSGALSVSFAGFSSNYSDAGCAVYSSLTALAN